MTCSISFHLQLTTSEHLFRASLKYVLYKWNTTDRSRLSLDEIGFFAGNYTINVNIN